MALYGLNYINEGLYYVCTYVDCSYFSDDAWGLTTEQYTQLCTEITDYCSDSYMVYEWIYEINNGHEWNTDYCYNYLY